MLHPVRRVVAALLPLFFCASAITAHAQTGAPVDSSVRPITSLPKPPVAKDRARPVEAREPRRQAQAEVRTGISSPPEALVLATPEADAPPVMPAAAAPAVAPVTPVFLGIAVPEAGETAPSPPVAVAVVPPMQALRASTSVVPASRLKPKPVHAFSTVAIAATTGIGGFGAQIATPLTQTTNLRFGVAAFSYSGSFKEDGLGINGDVKFRSGMVAFDWFPFHGGFHISPGVTLYNGNNLNASVLVPAGQSFQLDGVGYTSSAANPVHGTGSLTFGKRSAPNLTIGWGNMIPRSGRHFSVPFEIGFEYIGDPTLTFNLQGTACGNAGCSDIGTDPQAQANLRQEQNNLNADIAPLRFYPITSVGIAYRF